ncbi:MAG: GNAT family N-acetyltransferase [Flavobacterium sp.]|nr:GNAT family N-acetyltransferase [Flavobacterium sp.]
MQQIQITQINHNQIHQLQEVGKKNFYETFAEVNSEENMKTYLEKEFAIDYLQTQLNNTDSNFYFATFNDNVIGYLKINFGSSQTELKDSKALEIERIYVLKEFHGLKVGQLLYEKALQIAKEKKVEYIWLGVWEENKKAIQFYTKNGFIVFNKHLFKLGNDEQTDLMMKLQVKSKYTS